jgi:uncharacterized membrane protein YkoI
MNSTLAAGILLAASLGGSAMGRVGVDTDYEKLFGAATFSLTEAIDKALAIPEAKDCIVVNAEIEEEGGKIIYSVQLAKGDKILEVNFDVTNGSMISADTENEDKSAQAKAAKITGKQAIATATKKPGTKTIEASLNLVEAKPVWLVKVWTAKKAEKSVLIDALTGEVHKAKKDPTPASAKEAEKAGAVAGDKMAPYKTLADEALKAFKAGDLATAKKKAKDLEKAWDSTSKTDLAKKPELWKEIDAAVDAFIDPLMKDAAPDAAKVQTAHKDLFAKLNQASAP